MNLDELQAILAGGGVDLAQWGVGQAKTIHNLLTEIESGESELQSNPLLRVVQVVQVIIRQGDKVLVEAEQELTTSGQKRARNALPSEKLKPGEDYAAAALRCLQEELHLPLSAVTLLPTTYRPSERIQPSPSYPGLLTHYILHRAEAQLTQPLPATDFWTDNLAHSTGDPIARQRWAWLPADSE